MSEELNQPSEEGVSNREIVEDTPENRAWIGETEPQPVPEKSDTK